MLKSLVPGVISRGLVGPGRGAGYELPNLGFGLGDGYISGSGFHYGHFGEYGQSDGNGCGKGHFNAVILPVWGA